MSASVIDHLIETDSLPHPATKLVITHCFTWTSTFWALLIVGAFYDAEGRVIWSTEIFFGQFGWLDNDATDTASEGDTETGTSSDSSSNEESNRSGSSADEDSESETEEDHSDSRPWLSDSPSPPQSPDSVNREPDLDLPRQPFDLEAVPPAFTPPTGSRLNSSVNASQGFWVDIYDPVQRCRVRRFIG